MSERLSLELVSLVTPTDFLVLCNPLLCRATQEGNDILMHRNSETCFSSFATSTFRGGRGKGEEGRKGEKRGEEERRGEKKEEEGGRGEKKEEEGGRGTIYGRKWP